MANFELDPEYQPAGPNYFVWIIQQPDKTWWVQEPDSSSIRNVMQAQSAKDIAIRFAHMAGKYKGWKAQVRVKLLDKTERSVWTYGVDAFPWE